MACTEPIKLPAPDARGYIHWPDGYHIYCDHWWGYKWVVCNGRWLAPWDAEGVATPGRRYLFDTPEAAAAYLASLGVGPGAKVEAEPEGPRWKHDCPHCVFLGRFGKTDLYYSVEHLGNKNRVLSRSADAPGLPMEGNAEREPDGGGIPSMNEARRRARERGLLPEPKPAIPDGFDAAKIPEDMEWTGECRLPRKGEWFLRIGDYGLNQADRDFTSAVRPILRRKPLPPTPATLSYRDEWPTPKAAGPEPKKENPMPETTPAPQGQPLSESELKTVVGLIGDLRKFKDARPAVAVLVSLVASHARCLQRRCEPVPLPLSAYVAAEPAKVHTLTPIPGAFARVLGAAGVAVLTGLSVVAGMLGGVALAVKFHLIG